MSQPKHLIALDLPEAKRDSLDPQIQAYFNKCDEKLGLGPNVLRAFSHNEQKLQNFMAFYDELMLGDSELSKLEREMIAVVVSSVNRCFTASWPTAPPSASSLETPSWGSCW